jgi:hypothetical protein
MKNKTVLAAFGGAVLAMLLEKLNCTDNDSTIIEKLNLIIQNQEIMATKQERFDAVLTRIDTATTNIAGDFRTFIQEVKDGTVTDESLARAEASAEALEAIAASKADPVGDGTGGGVVETGGETGEEAGGSL